MMGERWKDRRTVEKMAAGTLKMTRMMGFRFSRMNATASKLEKNLCVCALVTGQQ